MGDALTPEAKAELQDAVRIVREDKFYQYARTTLGQHAPKADAPKPPVKDPETPPTDPPKKDPVDEPADPPKTRSRYWGEI